MLYFVNSTSRFLESLHTSWAEGGFASGRPGINIERLKGWSNSEQNKAPDQRLGGWLSVHEELLTWAANYFFAHEAVLFDFKDKTPDINKGCVLFLSKIISDCLSIRLLIQNGFELSAQQVLRSLSENVDALNYCLIVPAAMNKFLNAHLPNESNDFWHRHISKGKARKVVLSEYHRLGTDQGFAQALIQFRNSQDELLAMTVHPSSVSGFLAAYGTLSHDDIITYPSFLGRQSDLSPPIVKYCAGLLFEIMFWSIKLDALDTLRILSKSKLNKSVLAHVHVGASAISMAVTNALKDQDG
jgi:hypothetical protein